jgi:hypothetical protein
VEFGTLNEDFSFFEQNFKINKINNKFKIIKILEPLVDSKFYFKISNLWLKTFKKLSLHTNSLERELF